MPDLKEVDKLIRKNGLSSFFFTIKDKQNIANDPELMATLRENSGSMQENQRQVEESSEGVFDNLVHAIQEFFHMCTCW